jgi:hypothetical protein
MIYEEMEKTISSYSDMNKFDSDVVDLFGKMLETRITSFEEQLSKFETIE